MKSNAQIRKDQPKMDKEQQECIQNFSVPKKWIPAPELDEFYDQLNASLFKGLLPKVPCYWSPPVRSFLGRCHARPHPKTRNMHSVALEFPSNSPDGALYDTVIHEMVHVFQTVIGVPLNHNRLFHNINKNKRATYVHQKKRKLDPLLYPPRNIKRNKMWSRAHDIERQLEELSELLFETPVPIPTCWWHSTKTRTTYTLESYWCHTTQMSMPNTLELSKKVFAPNEFDFINILCTIASWKAKGIHKQRKYKNELFVQKKREYFGEPQRYTSHLSEIKKDFYQFSKLFSHHKEGVHYTPKFILGTCSSGKTHTIHNLYAYLRKEDT